MRRLNAKFMMAPLQRPLLPAHLRLTIVNRCIVLVRLTLLALRKYMSAGLAWIRCVQYQHVLQRIISNHANYLQAGNTIEVNITATDLCDSPGVPSTLAPSTVSGVCNPAFL